jgi:hypothetical protein
MNLYEIETAILGCIDTDTGEVIDTEKLEELSMERDVKVENICLWIKNLKAEVEALKAEKDAFAQRQKVAENKMNSLKQYISAYLEGTPFTSTRVSVSFRKSESLEISEEAIIPDDYMKIKAPEVDKVALKAAIKNGNHFDGVEIVEKQNIQIK